MNSAIRPIATVEGAYLFNIGKYAWRKAWISLLQPSIARLMQRNGIVQAINGILRPHLLRWRSLLKLTYGHTVMLKTLGTVDRINPIIQLEHPRDFSFNGSMLGTTVSIRVKQKSPQSSDANNPTNPIFAYVNVPQ